MVDPRHQKLAEVLVRYSTRVKAGDLVQIHAEAIAMPLIEAVYEAVIKAGGHPYWTSRSESLQELTLLHATDEQLGYVSPIEKHRIETIDVHIGLWAELNTKFLGQMEPARTARLQSAQAHHEAFPGTCRGGLAPLVRDAFPDFGAAQDAEMSLRQYEDFVFGAGLLHFPDPVAAWMRIRDRQQKVCDFLKNKKVLRFCVPPSGGHDGTDLTVDVNPSKSIWINCAGMENFPDGEVFTGPQGVDGHVNYTFPAVYQGREVEGVRLEFRGGRVVDASAKKNEEFLIKMLDQDAGGRTLGEIAIGTNYDITRFSRNALFDEKIGGTFHAAVGAGYPESGNTNESGLHWDMVCDLRHGGTIDADGAVFHRDGRFLKQDWPGND